MNLRKLVWRELFERISQMLTCFLAIFLGITTVVAIKNKSTDELETVPAAALFIFIGAKPHTDFVADLIELNEAGFILTGPDLLTNGRRPKAWPLKRYHCGGDPVRSFLGIHAMIGMGTLVRPTSGPSQRQLSSSCPVPRRRVALFLLLG